MKRSIVLSLMTGALLITGCGGGYAGYYANTPPPPVRVETFGPAPGPGYVWMSGFWEIAAEDMNGTRGDGNGLPVGGGVGKRAGGSTAEIAINSATAAGANAQTVEQTRQEKEGL